MLQPPGPGGTVILAEEIARIHPATLAYEFAEVVTVDV